MKINITTEEAIHLKNIMENTEEGSTKDFLESLKGNKALSVTPTLKGWTIVLNPEYMDEYLQLVEDFSNIFIAQVKTLYNSAVQFQEQADQIIRKYV